MCSPAGYQEVSPKVQTLKLPFTTRTLPGKITATIQPNMDAAHAFGLDIIFPSIPASEFPKQLFGFPVMQASIEYPTSPLTSQPSGYRSYFGWIQFVKATPTGNAGDSKETGEWEMDSFPYAQDLKMPFCYLGFNPIAFDAPARLVKDDGTFDEMDWRAQSFLCVLEDSVMSKKVSLVEGAAFGWGFDILGVQQKDGEDRERKIVIKELAALDAAKEWDKRLGLLKSLYTEWTFRSAGSNE